MAVFSSFCGLLTLQVGATVVAALFFALAAIILAANVFDYATPWDWSWPVNLILVLLIVALLVAIGACAFASSYSERRRLAVVAVVSLVVLLCFWIILCCFSFFGSYAHSRAVCVAARCPESLWIASLRYRGRANRTEPRASDRVAASAAAGTKRAKRHDAGGHFQVFPDKPVLADVKDAAPDDGLSGRMTNSTEAGGVALKRGKRVVPADVIGYTLYSNLVNETIYPKRYLEMRVNPESDVFKVEFLTSPDGFENGTVLKKFYTWNSDGPHAYKLKFNGTVEEERVREEEYYSRFTYGWPFVGAVILFAANLLFFIFSALIMWSWASELDWADYYIEDEPVVEYVEED